MLRDANMLVPDAQQPPANQDIDRNEPCPEDEEFFDRPDVISDWPIEVRTVSL